MVGFALQQSLSFNVFISNINWDFLYLKHLHKMFRTSCFFFFLHELSKVSHAIYDLRPPDGPWPPSKPVTSDRLFCPNPLPQTRYGETWENRAYRDALTSSRIPYNEWSFLNFSSLTDLCSVDGKPEANMGGIVSHQKLCFKMLLSL